MRTSSHTTLCSVIFSAILTSALVPSTGDVALASAGAPAVQMAVQSALSGMRAQGFAGGAELSLPPSAATPASAQALSAPNPASPLTPELMTKMLHLIALIGIDREVSVALANALGLSATGQTWADRQAAAKLNSSDSTHGFAISRGDDQDIVLSLRLGSNLHAFRAHRDGTVVTALISDTQTHAITMRAPAEAQAELDGELAFWAANVDALIAGR